MHVSCLMLIPLASKFNDISEYYPEMEDHTMDDLKYA